MKYSVLIPCHNESKNIYNLITSLKKNLSKINHEIIIVDDGSTDNTYEVLENLIKTNSLRYIKLSMNYGQSIALQAGMDQANFENIITLDGDGQNDTNSITKMIEIYEKERLHVLFGNRKRRNDEKIRVNLSRVANYLIRLIFKINIKDFGCSLRIFKKKLLNGKVLYSEQHRILPLILIYKKKIKFSQIDVGHNERKFGKSHYGNKRVIKLLLDLLIFICLQKFKTKPIYFFGIIFLFFLSLSIITFILMLYIKFILGNSFILTPLPVLATLFLSMSFTSLMLGFVCEIIVNTYLISNDNKFLYQIDDEK